MEQQPGAEACFECTKLLDRDVLTVRRLKRAYCGSCWIYHCGFRFRKRLFELARPEKGSRLPPSLKRPIENVLIYFDGSGSSLALLHLIRDAVRANTNGETSGRKGDQRQQQQHHLPLPFTFSILFIYDEVGGKLDCMEKLMTLQRWQEESRSRFDLDFPIMVSSLECSLSVPHGGSGEEGDEKGLVWVRIPSKHPAGPDTTNEGGSSTHSTGLHSQAYSFPFSSPLSYQLSCLVKNLKTETSKKDFLHILREKLMLNIAKKLDAKKIFLPEEQTGMAIKMFSLMSLGRGSQLAEQMALATEIESVKFVRPLMDLEQDDLRDYLTCLNEDTGGRTESGGLSTMPGDKLGQRVRIKAIQDQCEEFIVDLQHGYASTVPTLTRIGAKLKPTHEDDGAGEGVPMGDGSGPEQRDNSRICTFCRRSREDSDDEGTVELGLCYGCMNILRDMRDSSPFRAWLTREGL